MLVVKRLMMKTSHIAQLMLALLTVFFLLSFCTVETIPSAWATTYYVAKNGNNSYNGLYPSYQGGSNGPFATLTRAANVVKAGDTVRIREGIYQEKSTWRTSGTAGNPINITNHNDEIVVIDGNNHTIPSADYEVLFRVNGDWYKVSNLEIRYSGWYGISFYGDHCTADHIYCHHSWAAGINYHGSYGLIKNCRSWWNSARYDYGTGENWSTGISIMGPGADYCTIRNCVAWENWGQGIKAGSCTHATIEDCVAYNNMHNYYIKDTQHTLVQRNLSYNTEGNTIQQYVTYQVTYLIGDERAPPPSSNNTFINNLGMGGRYVLSIGTGTMENCLFANNTFVNASNYYDDMKFAVRIGRGNYSNARFQNNIIIQDDDTPIATSESSGIVFSNNIWSKQPPRNCRGTDDVTADPKLTRTGSTAPGSLAPGWFKILENSPAKDRAKILSQVTEDFFKNPRGSKPDMGAIELASGPSPLTALAAGSPTSGQAPLVVNFTGNAAGGNSPYTYKWNFGDGGSSTNRNPTHSYSSGTFTATLTVTDSASNQASDSVAITVTSGTVTQSLNVSAKTGNPAPGNGGTTNPAPGNHSYPQGSSVSVNAIPQTKYRFSIWSGDVPAGDTYDGRITVLMNRNKSLTAHFCTRCGDANGDLDITGYDAQTAFDMFLKRISDPPLCQFENADVDCNGTITPADAQAIFNKFLGRMELPSNCSGKTRTLTAGIISMREKFPPLLLHIEDVRVNSEGFVLVPIIIDNLEETDAFGLDLAFPSNVLTYLSLESAELTQGYEQMDGRVITSPEMNPQILRIGGYKSGPVQNPSYGVLLTLVFKATEELAHPVPLSVIATYDDFQKASVIDGMVYPRIKHPDREQKGLGKKVRKKLPSFCKLPPLT